MNRESKSHSTHTDRATPGRRETRYSSSEGSYEVKEEEHKPEVFDKSNASAKNKQSSTPAAVLKLCKTVKDLYEKKRLPELEHSKFTFLSIQSLTRDNEDGFDYETRKAIPDLNEYYKEASAGKNVPFLEAINRVESFIEGEPSAIMRHAKFPKKPISATNTYHRRLAAKGIKMKITDAKAKFDNDPTDPEVAAAINEYNEEYENYGNRIRDFMDEEKGSILPHQVTYLNKMIRTHEEKVSKMKSSGDKGVKRVATTKPAGAFDIYVTSVGDKYSELSDSDRTKKLRQEYEKLSTETRNLLEMQARNARKDVC